MSIGNQRNSDQLGKNTPYQLAVVQLLKLILAAGGGGGSGAPLNTKASGTSIANYPTSRSKTADVVALDTQLVDANGNPITAFGGGVDTDGDPITVNKPGLVGGKAIVNDGSYTPNYSLNDAVLASFDNLNGALNVNQGNLNETQDQVTAFARTTSSNVAAGTLSRVTNASNTGRVIKNATGNLYKFNITNLDTALIYVKFYNKATAPSSSDTPFWTVSVASGAGSHEREEFTVPIPFASGLSVRCVTDSADNGTTSPSNSPIIESHIN